MKRDRSRLPDTIAPRLLSRDQAAEYVAQSLATFDALVSRGELPKPLDFSRGHARWDRKRIDDWLDDMSGLRTPVDRDKSELDAQLRVGRHAR